MHCAKPIAIMMRMKKNGCLIEGGYKNMKVEDLLVSADCSFGNIRVYTDNMEFITK